MKFFKTEIVYAQNRSSSAVLCAWGGGREASSFYKFPRNVIMSQEHHKNIRWERRVDLVGLFTTVIYASESEERELCRGSEFTKVSRRECENELVVVDAHTINRTKEDTHTHTTKQEKKFLFFFFFFVRLLGLCIWVTNQLQPSPKNKLFTL